MKSYPRVRNFLVSQFIRVRHSILTKHGYVLGNQAKARRIQPSTTLAGWTMELQTSQRHTGCLKKGPAAKKKTSPKGS